MELVKNNYINTDSLSLLQGAIIETIAFFDIFSFPLTEFEIWKYSSVKFNLGDIIEILNYNSPASLHNIKNLIESKNGFYFLKGKSELYDVRMKRYNNTNKKFKKAKKIARIFKAIPWIKMIALANIMGANNLKEDGDIDLFIITENKRIWITRFFCVITIIILGLRPMKNRTKDKICLSFFITESDLNLKRFMLDSNDYYFIYWIAGLVPIYDKGGIYKKFIKSNRWINEHLPNWFPTKTINRSLPYKKCSFIYRDLVDLLIGGLEKNMKKIQMNRLPENIKKIMNLDTRVLADNQVLKFHVNDRRKEFNEAYEKERLMLSQKL